jgi:N6-adenosine-specific RNA methylase IME4
MTRYRTIVADPPWDVQAGPKHFQARKPTRADAGSHDPRYTPRSRPLAYDSMTLDAIKGLPVADLAEPNAHLYLWTINAFVEDAYDVARAWGFKPSTLLTWCKAPRGIGLGGAYALATEHVLFCRRGSLKALTRVDTNWWKWTRTAHSVKPEAFQDIVESVSPGPYLELFARRKRLGWDSWGNEIESDLELAA